MRQLILLIITFAIAGDAAASRYLFAQPNASAPASIAFTGTGITVGPVTTGGTVFAYSIAREPQGYRSSVVPREVLLRDDDRDGIVEWHINQPVPLRSMWFAIDLASGSSSAAAPPAYGATRLPITADVFRRDTAGDLTHVLHAGSVIEVLLIRPGGGIWGESFAFGGALDERTTPGRLTASLARLRPRLGTTGPPPKPKKDDIIIVVNAARAEYVLYTVGER